MAIDFQSLRKRVAGETCRIHGVPMQLALSAFDPAGEGFIYCPVCRASERAEFDPAKTRFPEGAEL